MRQLIEKEDYEHIREKSTDNKVRAEVGMVFQSFNLFPHKTVFENVTLAQLVVRKRSREDTKKKANLLLNKVGISDKANAYPDNLSGGGNSNVSPLPGPWPWTQR